MTTLRITQTTESTGRYRVELSLACDGLAPQNATASFLFEMSRQDQEDLRWYLEDYLQFPHDPAPTIAARIEQRMAEIGTELFQAVFDSSTQATRLWAKVSEWASDLRVEIVTSVREAAAIPWELLRDPHTDTVLALSAAAFVRTHQEAAVTPKPLDAASGPIRILLVICRPRQADDVPFRSVASRLVKALTNDARAVFQLDVLRPPTYDQFAKTLRQAKRDGRPYHIVHFDGHGMYAELSADHEGEAAYEWLKRLIPLMLSGPREGSHGYLLFENAANDQNLQLVDGDALGKLLYETNTPVLVLNACRSAHADVAEQPEHADSSDEMHAQVRSFGSLAQEVIDAGVTGVVAMRYNVYVVTAAQFVADLYAALVQGNTLGEAVTLGRKQLRDNPNRTIAFAPRPLQDWCVPLVYEAMPTALFETNTETQPLSIEVAAAESSAVTGSLDRALPDPPDVGFFGRDETLLALDRAFDTQPIVLLHAYAGSGKTATAAEFARWYSLTGGVAGPVLFTSFEQHQPLARVLDRVGEIFVPTLEQSGVNWLALDDDVRRDVALQIFRKMPVLWIWDNVEPVAGFPAGTKSAWSDDEQQELVDFLRDAARTKAKFLLTSRREEREWLGDNLPCRIQVPPMPMQERVQLARAIAQRQRRKLTDVDDWRPLLKFTSGNLLTITVVVGQALRDGLKTRDEIEAFVEKLCSGEVAFDDDVTEGRDRSLAASLSYGFGRAFDERERRQLAVLHLFHDFIDVQFICAMGNMDREYCLSEFANVTPQEVCDLLDRAAEVGFLTYAGHGCYSIHPALPKFFRQLAVRYDSDANLRSTRAFVDVMAWCAHSMNVWIDKGHGDARFTLAAAESNLLHAREISLRNMWWNDLSAIMYGLATLYEHEGQFAEFSHLVDELVPLVTDNATNLALPQRERAWKAVTEFRARLAFEKRNLDDARTLHGLLVRLDETNAQEVLKTENCISTANERNLIRSLAVSLGELGNVERELKDLGCISTFRRSITLARRIDDTFVESDFLQSLGVSYLTIDEVMDLDESEKCFRRVLEIAPAHDNGRRSKAIHELGCIYSLRSLQCENDGLVAEARDALHESRRLHEMALALAPPDAIPSLAARHQALGDVYSQLGDIDRALMHFRESIRYFEQLGDAHGAGKVRTFTAMTLGRARRYRDALEYARAAKCDFESFGAQSAELIQFAEELIAKAEEDLDAQ